MVDEKILFDDDDDSAPQGSQVNSTDILQRRFSMRFRGYDTDEVDSFLEAVAKELDRIAGANKRLQDKLNSLKQERALLREKEINLNEALLSVQKIDNDIRDNALKEASLIVSGAQLDAEKIIAEVRQQCAVLHQEINLINQKRAQFEVALKSLLQSHLNMLDTGGGKPGE